MITELKDEEQEVIYYVLYASSGLSLLGSGFIILTYIFFKNIRSYGTTLIFWLSLSDFLTSISWFPWNRNEQLCVLQAMTLQFFEIASYFWSCAISFSLFQVFYLESLEERTQKHIWIGHLITWGYGGIAVVVCLVKDKFGKAGAWCWIKDPQDPYRLFTYGPMLAISIFICFTWISIRWKLRTKKSDFKSQLNRKISMYLLAFLTSQIPAIVNRAQNYISPDNPQFFLFVLQAIFQPAQGFLNSLVYGFNEEQFVEQYRHFFQKWRWNNIKSIFFKNKKRNYKINATDGEQAPIFDYDYQSDEEEEK